MVHKMNSPTFSDFGPKLWKLESFLESFLLFPETNLHWYDERGRTSSPVEYHLFAHGRLCLSQDDLFLPIPSIIPEGHLYKEFIYCPKNASVVRFVYLTLILNGQEGAVAFAWDDLNTWEKIVGWPLLSEEKQLSFLFSFFICRDFDFQHFDILLNTVKIKRIGIRAGMTRCWMIVVFKWSEGLVCSFQAYHQFCVVHIEHTIHAPLLGRKKLCCLICRSSGGTASEHLIHIFQNLALLLYPADVH